MSSFDSTLNHYKNYVEHHQEQNKKSLMHVYTTQLQAKVALETAGSSLLPFQWIEGENGRCPLDNVHSAICERFHLYVITKAIDVNSTKLDLKNKTLPPLPSIPQLKHQQEDLVVIGDKKQRHKEDTPLLDFSGDTLLHWACRCGNVGIVKFLLCVGADKDALNDRGFKPQDVICTRAHDDGQFVGTVDQRNFKKTYMDYDLSTLGIMLGLVQPPEAGATSQIMLLNHKLSPFVSWQHHCSPKYLEIACCLYAKNELLQRISSVIEAEQAAYAARLLALQAHQQEAEKKPIKQKKQKLNP